MIQAVIYDMDGLIIDSEPLWQDAEMAAFGAFGISLTREQCKETQGLRLDEVVLYWQRLFPQIENHAQELQKSLWDNVMSLVRERGVAKEGVVESLEFFKSKQVHLALASTSAMVLIDTVLDKLRLREYFEELHSAEFEQYGKPHPGVYITTAQKLSVSMHACLAIEDSINGILAAKAAKMKCLAVPENIADKRLGIADAVIPSLALLDNELWTQLN
jgi:beta-phosphoglucomutase-like phosphatase (HAD superfamily)